MKTANRGEASNIMPTSAYVDELGYVHLDPRGAELVFQIITAREERASIACASNAPSPNGAPPSPHMRPGSASEIRTVSESPAIRMRPRSPAASTIGSTARLSAGAVTTISAIP
jgi:hypothetical protein